MLTSLSFVFLLGLAMAALCQKFKIPRIIGMLVTGILLGPCVLNWLSDSVLGISSELRQMALIIILLKVGLSLNLADEGSCVFIGRCADYALEDYPNVVSVFITGDEEDKIKRISELYDVDEAKAKDLMVKTDKRRASYYNYYSNKKWGDPKSYDMCINSSAVGPEGAVDLIMELAKKKQEWNKKK